MCGIIGLITVEGGYAINFHVTPMARFAFAEDNDAALDAVAVRKLK